MAYDPTKNKGQGTEDIDPSVLGLPFLTIIQKGSPEFDETHRFHKDKKIEGCKPGNIVFAQKRKVLAQPLLVIPVGTATLYTEWKPREQGGGFQGNRALTIVTDGNYRRGQPGSPTEYNEYLGSNELKYTIYFMFLFKHGEEWEKGVISFTQGQLKNARKWLRGIQQVEYKDLPGVKPPIFAALYQLGTFADTNTKGGFFSWTIIQDHVLDLTKEEGILTMAEKASVEALAQLPAPTAPKAALPAPKVVKQEDSPF